MGWQMQGVIAKEKYRLRESLAIAVTAYRAVNFSFTRVVYPLPFCFTLLSLESNVSIIDRPAPIYLPRMIY